ncbi:carboxypeptidase-like regulatory domain-containing protein [Aquimarina aquimarini]|uniref:carboxypeptidase-like regulatory domain-containing protein n=1 Tax=Aquimarina aquimarini TaxID=1191734 RepID=UPI00131EE17A|nr:carboxypeptidase-like regulatory domain-containing protein [Aquimarina aquimarini]
MNYIKNILFIALVLIVFSCKTVIIRPTVKGVVYNESNIPIKEAQVGVYKSVDSSFVKMTKTNSKGEFILPKLSVKEKIIPLAKRNNYNFLKSLFIIKKEGYQEYLIEIDVQNKDTILLKSIILKQISQN